MRFHFEDDHPRDAAARIVEVLCFLECAVVSRGMGEMGEAELSGLSSILMACRLTLQSMGDLHKQVA